MRIVKHELVIERAYPAPNEKGFFTKLVLALKVGESVELKEMHRSAVTVAANRNEVPITTRKTRHGHFRVWRISEEEWLSRGYGRQADTVQFELKRANETAAAAGE